MKGQKPEKSSEAKPAFSGKPTRPMPDPGQNYPGLAQMLQTLRAKGYEQEFVLHEGALVLHESGKTYKPEKLRVTGMFHVDSGKAKPNLLFLLQATDGKRGWVAELSGNPTRKALSGFLDKVLTESTNSKINYGI